MTQDVTRNPAEIPPIPPELDRWNWGAFLLTWIWGLGNRVWIALLVFIPLVNVVIWVMLGLRGSRWAWEKGGWEDPEGFRYAQKVWAWVGAGFFAFILLFGIGGAALVFSLLTGSEPYRMAMTALERDDRVIETFGGPLEAGWFVSGSISQSTGSGEADLSIPISGSRASGMATVKALKVVGEWELLEVMARPEGGAVIVVIQR